jgi:hypothetical protein
VPTLPVILLVGLALLAPAARGGPAAGTALVLERGGRLSLPATINGHAVSALLDSAAEMTLVDSAYARAIGLAAGTGTTGQGSGHSSFAARLVDGVTLRAAGVTLTGRTVAVTDLGDVSRRLLGHPLAVIVGRELFDAARLEIDVEGRRIAVVDRGREPRGVRLDLVTEHGVETLPLRIDGGMVRATFDLGNGSHLLVSSALAAQRGWLHDGRAVTTERAGGLGGETTREVLTLAAVELAGRRFGSVTAAIDHQPSAAAANVGVEMLRHFLITTDYAAHAIWLAPRD